MSAAGQAGRSQKEAALFILVIVGISGVLAVLALSPTKVPTPTQRVSAVSQGLGSFDSYSQLQAYTQANARSAQQYSRYGGFGGGMLRGGLPLAFGGVTTMTMTNEASSIAQLSSVLTPSYTGTNVQVQGVDELDRVKTDGTHLFVSANGAVSIVNAYPPNSTAVLSVIRFQNSQVLGLEIAADRLMIINQRNTNASYVDLLLYDTSSLSSPRLMRNVSVAGSFVAARLAQGYLYAVIQQPSFVYNSSGNATAVMPAVSQDGTTSDLAPPSIYHTSNIMQINFYSIIPSINMQTGSDSVISVLTGPSATVYVSTSNIYVVYTNYLDVYDVDGVPGDMYTGGVVALSDAQGAQNSTIMRASYASGVVTVAAAGVVPGTVLNQFSLDEYNGYFRVATSRFAVVDGSPTTNDDVYVLDQSMKQVSALRNIAPGENIYAVRFVGDMGYVVTFVQIDPLFVISFKDVSNPVILSALKVNGYSDYLHPLPGGYLLGIGKDSTPASQGNYAFYLGLKLSLFRVFDNGSSIQVSKLLIGDRGTDSPVLSDHLAFTFDSTKNITVIPLTLYLVNGNQTDSGGYPAYGDAVWQGVYVIKVLPTGFAVLGRVSQYPGGSFSWSSNNSLQIDRSVIIGDYLYTISQGEVMVSALSSFSTVATVQLS